MRKKEQIKGKEKEDLKPLSKIIRIILLICWVFGNLIIFSMTIYVKWEVTRDTVETLLFVFIMIGWVMGQIKLIDNKNEL